MGICEKQRCRFVSGSDRYCGYGRSEPDFASYSVIRNNQNVLTTADRNTVWFFDVPSVGTLSYKIGVTNQAGLSSFTGEIAGRKLAPEEVIFNIPGIPEPGDTSFPSNIAIPSLTFAFSKFDCPRDVNFSCTGSFIRLSTALDGHGHVIKGRIFNAVLNNMMINNQANLKFMFHVDDTLLLHLTASRPRL